MYESCRVEFTAQPIITEFQIYGNSRISHHIPQQLGEAQQLVLELKK